MKEICCGNDLRNLCHLNAGGVEERTMKKLILFLSFVVVALFAPYYGWTQERQMHTPVITHAYATQKGASGTSWKIYLEAEDAGGDMNYVYVVVDQTGQSSSSPERLILDPQHQSHLKAFVEWSRAGAGLAEGTHITVRISIADRARNVSNEVVFPFTFVSGVIAQKDVPAPFDGINIPRIGYIGSPHYEPGPF